MSDAAPSPSDSPGRSTDASRDTMWLEMSASAVMRCSTRRSNTRRTECFTDVSMPSSSTLDFSSSTRWMDHIHTPTGSGATARIDTRKSETALTGNATS